MAADFASMLYGTADKMTTAQPMDLAGNYVKGAQLALQREQLEQAKAKAAQDQKALEAAKMDKFIGALQKGAKYEGQARSNYFNKWLPTYRDALGLTESFPNEALKFVTGTPENLARINTLIAQVRDPESGLTEAEALAIIQDPSQFADVPPEVLEENVAKLAKAAGTKIGAQAQRASLASQENRFSSAQDVAAENRFQTNVLRLQDRTEKQFKDLNAIKSGIKTSDTLLSELETKIKNGEKLTSAERAKLGVSIEPIVRGIGQAKGPLSDQDVSRILGRYGITGKFEEFTEKWLTGDVSLEQIQAFRDIIKTGAKNIDAETQKRGRIIRQGYQNLPGMRERSAEVDAALSLDEYLEPTLGTQKEKTPPPGGAAQRMKSLERPEYKAKLREVVSKSAAALEKAAADHGVSVPILKSILGME